MGKLALIVAAIVLLSGCTTLADFADVKAEDNASLCVTTEAVGRLTGARVTAKRIELPAGFDVTALSAADIEALERVLCR